MFKVVRCYRVKTLRGEEQQIKGELVLKEEKVYMSKDEELRVKIIQLHHDIPVARHKDKQKTIELIIRNYWQPAVTKEVGKYVEEYNMYQQMKNRMKTSAEKLKLSKVPEKPWTHLIVDFITKLPLVAGKNTILVVCNRLLKMTHFVATIEGILAKGLAKLFKNNM